MNAVSESVMNPYDIGGFGSVCYSRREPKAPNCSMRSGRCRWHVDEIFVKINCERYYLWCAVDHEGEVLEGFVTKARDKKAVLKFPKKATRKNGCPEGIVADRLRSYGASLNETGAADRKETGRLLNIRAENSHRPSTPQPTTSSTRSTASIPDRISS